jgi:hypothetical protein
VVAAVVAAVSCLVTVALFLHVVPPRSFEPPLLSAPPPLPESASPLVLPDAGPEGRVELRTPPLAATGPGNVGVRLATYARAPRATVTLEPRDDAGRPLGRCRFPPTGYTDNGLVVCRVERGEDVRSLVVAAEGADGPIAVYAALAAGVLRGGAQYGDPPRRGRADQVRAAWDRLAVTRPRAFGPLPVGLLLTAGLGLLGWAAWCLRRVPPPVPAARRHGGPS